MGRRLVATWMALATASCAKGQAAQADVDAPVPLDSATATDGPAVIVDAPVVPVDAPALALQLEPEVVWSSGQAPIALGAVGNRACFLSSVSGAFDASSDVHVYPSGQSWYVSGTGSVRAAARCLAWTGSGGLVVVSSPYTWSQGQSPVVMGPAADRLCGLTRMAGQFRGGGEEIRSFVETATWKLGGSSQQVNVAASAYCIVWSAAAGLVPLEELSWSQGDTPRSLGSNHPACLLTGIRGAFRGLGERVTIEQQATWVLNGSSQQSGVAARARCIGP